MRDTAVCEGCVDTCISAAGTCGDHGFTGFTVYFYLFGQNLAKGDVLMNDIASFANVKHVNLNVDVYRFFIREMQFPERQKKPSCLKQESFEIRKNNDYVLSDFMQAE